jgi:hypothetical protein
VGCVLLGFDNARTSGGRERERGEKQKKKTKCLSSPVECPGEEEKEEDKEEQCCLTQHCLVLL